MRSFLFACGVASVMGSTLALAASTPNVVANQNSSLILAANNTVCSLGQNNIGQLGDGTAVDRSVRVTDSYLNGAVAVSIGYNHGLAVKSDGSVWAWGSNDSGRLGDAFFNRLTPYPVPTLAGFVAVSAGGYHSLALKNDGTVWGWGLNDNGQVGDGSRATRSAPVQVINLTGVTAILATFRTSYAIRADGTLWAWGDNSFYQYGSNSAESNSPVQIYSGVAKIAATGQNLLVLRADGQVWGWGYNAYGQLGNGTYFNASSPVRAGTLSGITAIATGDFHSLAVDSGGNVWSWGANSKGQLGDSSSGRNSPAQIAGPTGAVNVAANSASSYAQKADGSFLAWGDNTYGQLGIGSNAQSNVPVAAKACAAYPAAPGPPISSNMSRLSANRSSSLALIKDNSAYSWGQNNLGQLGDGTASNRPSPVPVAPVTNATSVSQGFYVGLASRIDGTVAIWGTNYAGTLIGNGATGDHFSPITVPNLSGVVQVAAGWNHNLVLKNDGTVWAWGFNTAGMLGDGTTNPRNIPTQVINLSGVVQIAANRQSSFALKSDGTVWAWGENGNGELGDNTGVDRLTATPIPNLAGVVALATGTSHTLALKNDGTVWGWGFGSSGQLGTGKNYNSRNIVRVSDLINVIAIAAGDTHSLAVKSDGTVWSWGNNNNGQLGNSSTTTSFVPVQVTPVSGFANPVAIAGGLDYSLAILKDGTLWAWGNNPYGQFGSTAFASRTQPVNIQTSVSFGPFWNVNVTQNNAAGGSRVSVNPPHSDNVYVDGSRVCFMPAPAVGYAFQSLTSSGLDASNCLTVGANASLAAAFAPSPPLRFVKVTPCRIADTRQGSGPFGGPILAADSTRDFPVPQSSCNIPATAKAYSLNFTVVPPAPLSYLSAWPSGVARPLVSVLNSFDGRVKAGAAIVPAGADGSISVYVSEASHAIIDVNGYFVDDAANSSALQFYPVTPCRLSDTRSGSGAFGTPALVANQIRTFPLLSGACQLPPTAQAYSLNMTVVPKEPLTYLTVWPAGEPQPLVSTLNAFRGEVVANAAIVPAGQNGDINVFVTNNTELIIDVNGYFALPGQTGLSLYNVTPCRVIDTRSTPETAAFKGTVSVNAATSGCYVPAGTQSIVYNATVVPSGPLNYLSLWPSGLQQPLVSTLNSFDGTVSSNLAIVPDTGGSIDAFTSDNSHLILDVSGYFAKEP